MCKIIDKKYMGVVNCTGDIRNNQGVKIKYLAPGFESLVMKESHGLHEATVVDDV